MDEVIEALNNLIDKYKFNIDVLSKLTGIETEKLLSRDKGEIFNNSKDTLMIMILKNVQKTFFNGLNQEQTTMSGILIVW